MKVYPECIEQPGLDLERRPAAPRPQVAADSVAVHGVAASRFEVVDCDGPDAPFEPLLPAIDDDRF